MLSKVLLVGIENSLTTMNKKDPVSEENSKLWNSGVESDKEIARKRKRKLTYYTNIMVVVILRILRTRSNQTVQVVRKSLTRLLRYAPTFEDENL